MSALSELAARAWPILTTWAEKYKEPISYDTLLQAMGYTGFSNIGQVLWLIREYCGDHGVGGLPRLSSIVVSQDTGVPSNGDPIDERVYKYPWHDRHAPTAQDFEKYERSHK